VARDGVGAVVWVDEADHVGLGEVLRDGDVALQGTEGLEEGPLQSGLDVASGRPVEPSVCAYIWEICRDKKVIGTLLSLLDMNSG
jgi:hypothetical protein